MFCRYCGRKLEDGTSFCPGCGQPIGSMEPRSQSRSGRDLGRSGVIGFLAIIGLAVVAVALVFAMGALSFEDDGSVRISDDVTVSGALADGTVTVSDLGYGIEFYYNDFESGQWSYFWRIHGDDGTVEEWNTYSPRLLLDKDDIRPGHYDFGVASTGSSAEGGFTLYGTVEDTFEWRYGGALHSVSVSYEYSEYEDASDNIVFQTYGSPEADTVSQLESSLRSEYLRVNGADAPVDGQDYADFILAFVQVCFAYELDYDVYGYEEYWAFPIETLYLRCGDCEDTAILCAALYDAAGFDAGVFLVPGHAFTAPHLHVQLRRQGVPGMRDHVRRAGPRRGHIQGLHGVRGRDVPLPGRTGDIPGRTVPDRGSFRPHEQDIFNAERVGGSRRHDGCLTTIYNVSGLSHQLN